MPILLTHRLWLLGCIRKIIAAVSILAMWLHGVYDGKSVSLHEVTIGCCVERYAVATHGFSLAIVHAL